MPKEKCPICNKQYADVDRHIKRVHEQKESKEIPIFCNGILPKMYATRTFTTFTEFDFRITLMNEKTIVDNKEAFLGESVTILTPTAAKELSTQLHSLLEDWENTNGPIKPRPQKSIFTKMTMQ